MFSRKNYFFWSLSVLFIGLLSCAPKIGEQPPPPMMPGLSATKCLDQATQVLKKFARGESQERELGQSWDCIGVAFEMFQKYVRGSQSDRYTPAELSDFLAKNFFEKGASGEITPINPALQIELMKIKQIFIGGSREYIARSELPKILNLVRDLKTLSLQLNTAMAVLTLNWKPTTPDPTLDEQEFFEKANHTVQDVSSQLANLIQENHQAYKFADFLGFLTELSGFYGEKWNFIEQIKTYLPVIEKIKVAVSGGEETEIGATEWPSFILLGARGYIQYLRFYYFMETTQKTGGALKLTYLSRAIEDSISIFQDLVNIKPTKMITKAETRDILVALSQAWPKFKISDRLIDEGMKLKQIVFGGSVQAWTVNDFNTARLKVPQLKVLTEKAQPYFSIYSSSWKPNVDEYSKNVAFFTESEKTLMTVAIEIGQYFESSYSIDDFVGLIAEIELLYPKSPVEETAATLAEVLDPTIPTDTTKDKLSDIVRKYEALFLKTKGIIYGDETPIIPKEIWSSFLSYVAHGYTSYLYYHYFMSPFEINSSRGAVSLGRLVENGADILHDIIKQRKDVGISYSEISGVLGELRTTKVIPEKLQLSTLQSLAQSLVENFLVSPSDRLAHHVPTSFNMVTLDRLRLEFRTWIQTEIFLASIYENPAIVDPTQVQLVDWVDKKRNDSTTSPELKRGLDELFIALKSPVPMTTDSEGRLLISNRLLPSYNRKSVFYVNLSQTIARLLTQSYILDLDRLKNHQGINKCEALQAFSSLKAPFIDLNLLDVKSTFVNARFLEANIFVPRADGDSFVNFGEFTDLTSMILSGLNNDSKLKVHLRKDCLITTDSTKKEVAKFGCIRRSYFKWMRGELSGLPDYITYMTHVDDAVWQGAFVNKLKAAGWIPTNQGNQDDELVKLTDISLLPHIIQYIEMIIAKFDSNKDGYLSTDEVLKAYPLFKTLIKDLAADYIKQGLIKEADLPAVFTFLVKYGEPPGVKTLFKWLTWKATPAKWDIMADRTQLAKILGYIADQTSTSTSAPPVCPKVEESPVQP